MGKFNEHCAPELMKLMIKGWYVILSIRDSQQSDTQHNNILALGLFNFIYFNAECHSSECCYAESYYAKCCYAESYYAEYHYADGCGTI
jgi:hypothetical protein